VVLHLPPTFSHPITTLDPSCLRSQNQDLVALFHTFSHFSTPFLPYKYHAIGEYPVQEVSQPWKYSRRHSTVSHTGIQNPKSTPCYRTLYRNPCQPYPYSNPGLSLWRNNRCCIRATGECGGGVVWLQQNPLYVRSQIQ